MAKAQTKNNIKRKLSKGWEFTLTGVPVPLKSEQIYLSHYSKSSCSSFEIGDTKFQEKWKFNLYHRSLLYVLESGSEKWKYVHKREENAFFSMCSMN